MVKRETGRHDADMVGVVMTDGLEVVVQVDLQEVKIVIITNI